MDSDSDFSWFDLNNYKPFKTMSIDEWNEQLFYRYTCYSAYKKYSGSKRNKAKDHDKSFFESIEYLKKGVIHDPENDALMEYLVNNINDRNYPSTPTVNFITFIQIWRILKETDLTNIWSTCSDLDDVVLNHGFNTTKKSEIEKQDAMLDAVNLPHDLNLGRDFSMYYGAHIKIDLSATDKQIKNDFSQWLSDARELRNAPYKKDIFTQSYFDKLVKYGVVQYFDISLISELEGCKITQTKISKMIFPEHTIDTDVDLVERLRKVTKPMAENIKHHRLDRALSAQLVYEKIKGMKNA